MTDLELAGRAQADHCDQTRAEQPLHDTRVFRAYTTNFHTALDCNKVVSRLFAFKKMCNIQTKKAVYFALIHSYISFGLAVNGNTSVKNLIGILKVQKVQIGKYSILNCLNRKGILSPIGYSYCLQSIKGG